MTQNIVVIGDTHFGIKNNSMTWLKHQKAGFEEIIEYIKTSVQQYDFTTVVHVGDLFDSRSSINPLVYKEVLNLLDEVDGELGFGNKGEMFILGGNHDYYYPWESDRNFTGIQMLPPFNHILPVVNLPMRYGDLIFIPWYDFHNPEKLKKALSKANESDVIFTHTDPFHMDPAIRKLVGKHPLITGHIHQPNMDWEMFWLVTGASYPTDFTDTNSKRGFWTLNREVERGFPSHSPAGMSDFKVDFHPVESSIHFHTLTEDMLENWHNYGIKEDDYVEVVIKQSHMEDHKATIKELHDLFTTSITHLPEDNAESVFESTEVLNVDTVCKKMLPKKLKGCYQRMVTACSKKD